MLQKIVFTFDRGRYFNKAVQVNMSKPLRNLYIKLDVNTFKHWEEMAGVEENLQTFGNSDILLISGITLIDRK